MEQNIAPRRNVASTPADVRAAPDMSLVDCVFAMPERVTAKRASEAQKADAARLEAKLAAEMRSLIAARLRGEAR